MLLSLTFLHQFKNVPFCLHADYAVGIEQLRTILPEFPYHVQLIVTSFEFLCELVDEHGRLRHQKSLEYVVAHRRPLPTVTGLVLVHLAEVAAELTLQLWSLRTEQSLAHHSAAHVHKPLAEVECTSYNQINLGGVDLCD